MDYLTSMYIDNEMDLEEKRRFVEHIREDDAFFTQTLELLSQEQLLRTGTVAATVRQPRVRIPVRHRLAGLFRPLGFAAAGFCAAALLFVALVGPLQTPDPSRYNRFVLYEPDAKQVALAGSFTQWQRVSMTAIGSSGYWELHLEIPHGEHRYAYILDGARRMADPTLPTHEKDDFGGVNSILQVGERI